MKKDVEYWKYINSYKRKYLWEEYKAKVIEACDQIKMLPYVSIESYDILSSQIVVYHSHNRTKYVFYASTGTITDYKNLRGLTDFLQLLRDNRR